jgi:hypothetical protein
MQNGSWICLRIRLTGQTRGIHSIDLLDGLSCCAATDTYAVDCDNINRMLRLADSTLNRQMMMEDILLAWAEQTS